MNLVKDLIMWVGQYQRRGTNCRYEIKNRIVFYSNHGVKSAKVLVKQISFIILIYFLEMPSDTSMGKGLAQVLAELESDSHKAAFSEDHEEGNVDHLNTF